MRALRLLNSGAHRIATSDLMVRLMEVLVPWITTDSPLQEYAIDAVRALHVSTAHKSEHIEQAFVLAENQGQLGPSGFGHTAQALVDFATTQRLRERAMEVIFAFVGRSAEAAAITAVLRPLSAIATRTLVPHAMVVRVLEHAIEAYAPALIELLAQMDYITAASHVVDLFESPRGPATEAAALDYFRRLGYRPAARRFIHQPTRKRPHVVREMARILADWKVADAYGALKNLLEQFREAGDPALLADLFCSARRLSGDDQLSYLAAFLRDSSPDVRSAVKTQLGANQPAAIMQALAE